MQEVHFQIIPKFVRQGKKFLKMFFFMFCPIDSKRCRAIQGFKEMSSENIPLVSEPVECIFLDSIDFFAETDMYLLFLPFHFRLFRVIIFNGGNSKQRTWSEAK